MYKIYLDSTLRKEKSISLVRLENSKETILETVSGDIDIVCEIKNVLDKHCLALEDISEVVPNLGPGSFTGLKIGVTIANVLNWANGKKTIKNLDLPNYGRAPNITLKKF